MDKPYDGEERRADLPKAHDQSLDDRFTAIERRLVDGDKRMNTMQKSLAENTSATKEVLEIISMGKGFFKVCGYIGSFIKWLIAIGIAAAGLYKAWKSGWSA